MVEFITMLRLYLLVMSVLYIIKNIYIFVKIFKKKEGKMENTWLENFLLGSSISWVIICIILGL